MRASAWSEPRNEASDWSLPDADCVRDLVLPLALGHRHDVGARGGHTGCVPANINQACLSLKGKDHQIQLTL